MSETYCGKSCAECTYGKALQCPGCKNASGGQPPADCDLAKCCAAKGHDTCATCGGSEQCGHLSAKDRIPDRRRHRLETEAARRTVLKRNAPILGKWLWILFWLVIPSTIAGILTIEKVAELLPDLVLPGRILNFCCTLAYGVILLIVSPADYGYRCAGYCYLAAAAISGVVSLGFGGLFLSIVAAIIALVGTYQEYMAHGNVLYGVDNELSYKWTRLWKWEIGMYGALFGSLLLMLLIPFLGILVLLAAAIGLAVVGVLKLIYLYRTAQVFRRYTLANQ